MRDDLKLSPADVKMVVDALFERLKTVKTGPRLQMIGLDDLIAMLGNRVTAPTIWKYITDKEVAFPPPVSIGPQKSRNGTALWIESEVVAWIMNRPRRDIGVGRFAYKGLRDPVTGKPAPHLKQQRRKATATAEQPPV